MGVHRVGHLDETVRPLARDAKPYRSFLTRQPEDLLAEFDEFILERVHGGKLQGGAEALASERDAHLTLAIRSLIDHWPDLAPPHPDAKPREHTS